MTLERRKGLKADPEKIREWQRRSRKPIPPMSTKRQRERLKRAEVVLAARQRDGGCVGRGLIPDHHCSGVLDCHERIPRSAWRAGYLVIENVITLCREAHRWVHANEREAHKLGLFGYSWERPDRGNVGS